MQCFIRKQLQLVSMQMYMYVPILCTQSFYLSPLYISETERRGVCVSVLESSGPALIGHCIARSVVSKHIPGSLIAELDKVSSQSTSYHIRALSDALSESLSTSNLLAYCGFQAALQWSEADPGSDVCAYTVGMGGRGRGLFTQPSHTAILDKHFDDLILVHMCNYI